MPSALARGRATSSRIGRARRAPWRPAWRRYATAGPTCSARRAWCASRSACSDPPLGVQPLHGRRGSARVGHAADPGAAPLGDLLGQRVLERVLEFRKQARSHKGTRRPGGGQARSKVWSPSRPQRPRAGAAERPSPSRRRICSRRLSSVRSRSIRAARTACTVAGTSSSTGLATGTRPVHPPSLPSRPGSGCSPLEKRDCPRSARSGAGLERAGGQGPLRRARRTILPHFRAATDPDEVACSTSCPPIVRVLGAVVHQEQRAGPSGGSRPGCRAAPGTRCRSSGGPRRRPAAAAPGSPGARAVLSASSVRWRRCGGSRACHVASSTGTSRRARRPGGWAAAPRRG